MWPNPQLPAHLVTFDWETLNENFTFLFSYNIERNCYWSLVKLDSKFHYNLYHMIDAKFTDQERFRDKIDEAINLLHLSTVLLGQSWSS